MLMISPPLKCEDHPDNNSFTKVTTRYTEIDSRGKTPAKAKPSTIKVVYICNECDDIVRQEPVHEHRSTKR